MLTSEIYRKYVAESVTGNHSLMLPLTLRSYLQQKLSFVKQIGWPYALKRMMIIGGHNDTAEVSALMDFISSLTEKKALSEETSEYQAHVLSLSKKITAPVRHRYLDNVILHPFATFFESQQDIVADGRKPAYSDESESESSSKPAIKDQTRQDIVMTEPHELIKQSKLFLFGNLFCQFARKRTRKLENDAAFDPAIVRFIELIITNAPEESIFLFADLPRSGGTLSLRDYVTFITASSDIIVSNIETHRQEFIRSSKHEMEFFLVYKPASYRLSKSFYSTLAYLNSLMFIKTDFVQRRQIPGVPRAYLQLFNHTHNDLLNFTSLTRSNRFSEEALELDQTNAARILRIIERVTNGQKCHAAFGIAEKAFKRTMLLNWFVQVRKIHERLLRQ